MTIPRTMKLTKKNLKDLPALYANDGKGLEAKAVVKFFNPCGNQTWWCSEFDGTDIMFGGVDLGYGMELGYFSYKELCSLKGQFGLPMEIDKHFTPCTLESLREVA